MDFKDVAGPLSQFQAKKSERSSTLELLQAINAEAPAPVDQNRLLELFDALWPKLEVRLRTIPPPKSTEARNRTQAQILEDLVVATRRMEARLDAFAMDRRTGDEVSDSLRPLVEFRIDGKLARFGKASTAQLHVRDNVIESFASFSRLSLDEYGKSWFLKRYPSGRVVELSEGRALARKARRINLKLVLEIPSNESSVLSEAAVVETN